MTNSISLDIFGYTRCGNVPAPKNEGKTMANKVTNKVTVCWKTPIGGRRHTFIDTRAVYDTVNMGAYWITTSINEGKNENIKVYKNGRLIIREAIFV